MPALATTAPAILQARRELAAFAFAVFRVRELAAAGWGDRPTRMLELSRVQAAAGALAATLATSDIRAWAAAVMARQGPYRRALGNLRALEARPDAAAGPIGLATAELVATILVEFTGSVAGYLEHRSQLGDAALAALALAPSGLLRALGIGIVAAMPEEMAEDLKEGAADLLREIPWWAWAVLVALAATAAAAWLPRPRRR